MERPLLHLLGRLGYMGAKDQESAVQGQCCNLPLTECHGIVAQEARLLYRLRVALSLVASTECAQGGSILARVFKWWMRAQHCSVTALQCHRVALLLDNKCLESITCGVGYAHPGVVDYKPRRMAAEFNLQESNVSGWRQEKCVM